MKRFALSLIKSLDYLSREALCSRSENQSGINVAFDYDHTATAVSTNLRRLSVAQCFIAKKQLHPIELLKTQNTTI